MTYDQQSPIGIAWLEPDLTICTKVRLYRGAISGTASPKYTTDHPDYLGLIRHLGGLTVGQVKEIPPWPTQK